LETVKPSLPRFVLNSVVLGRYLCSASRGSWPSMLKYPWNDSSGQLSPLRLGVLVLLLMPVGSVAFGYATHTLGPRELNEAIQRIGLWGIRLIFIALAVAPLRQILQWRRLLLVRRMIGVAAFAYVFAHFLLYTADQAFDVPKIASEIVLRAYLTIGFTALLALAALAATSTDAMIRRVGRLNWERLHRLIYPIGILAVIHYCFQSKLELWEPTWMAGLLGWLLLYRVLARFVGMRGRLSVGWAAGLSVAAAVGTALGEATFFHVAYHAPLLLVLQANLTLTTGLRPASIVLAVGLAVTLGGALRGVLPSERRRLRPA
jgi:methionine sulfoxide reductase heme-binding subunit